MSLRLRADDGTLSAWTPADPLKVSLGVRTPKAGPATRARSAAVVAAARGALAFLGYGVLVEKNGGRDLMMTVAASSSEECDAKTLAARGYSAADFHYLCLKTHFRKPLAFTWDALAAARGELGNLRSSEASLSGVTLEPSSRGLTGYSHRFREALSRDLDFPEALSCIWDGLKPGALSPGSKAAYLRAALPALGLAGALPE